jgi:hypothetical protein
MANKQKEEGVMKSLSNIATAQINPPSPISLKEIARKVNMSAPLSLSRLINELEAPVSFHADITTPAGTALGGTVDLTLFSDGRYSFNVHMHDSGFDPYDFRVRCAVQAPSGVTLLFQTSGHTDGTGSDLLGDINRNFDHHEDGQNPLIMANWLDVRVGSMSVSKSYEDAGALNVIEDIAKDLLGFLVADVTFGVGLALVIVVSAQLADSLDASFVGTGGLVGVVVAGGVVWVFGPSAIIAAVVAGVAAGAITDALIKHRQMTVEEYRFANTVFGDTLPPREKFFITNLSHGGGRKYTWVNIDRSILMNLDDAFDDPMHYSDPNPNRGYKTKGQVFIHELVHAWQIKTESFTPGTICKAVFGNHSYTPNIGEKWSDMGLEQQAAIVDQWFGKYAADWNTIEDVIGNLSKQNAIGDPSFGYINNNIRLGQN